MHRPPVLALWQLIQKVLRVSQMRLQQARKLVDLSVNAWIDDFAPSIGVLNGQINLH